MSNEIKVGIKAKGPVWSLEIIDLETGKTLPIKAGSLTIHIPESPTQTITATATLIITELDLEGIWLKYLTLTAQP